MSAAPIVVRAVLTKGDYFGGVLSNTLRSPATLAIYGAGALAVAAIAFVVGGGGESLAARALVAGVALFAMLALYTLILGFTVFLAANRSWRTPGALAPLSVEFNGDGVVSASAAGRGETLWSLWTGAIETSDQIIVRHHLGLVLIVPKRFVEGEVLTRLRALLRQKLGANAHLREGSSP